MGDMKHIFSPHFFPVCLFVCSKYLGAASNCKHVRYEDGGSAKL